MLAILKSFGGLKNRSDNAAVVLPVGRNAYWSTIRLLGIDGKKKFLTNSFSKILARIGVTEIGRKSLKSLGG